nr:receptor-like protein 12 [Ipomoea trifida]
MHALGHCLPDQKSVLLQIRTEITYNSSESTKLVLWDEGADCCRWPGLSCNDAGYITSLDLSDDYSITGGFNVSLLYKLPSLSVIRLDWVYFSAPFPDFFKDFTNLTVLSLIGCNFSGTVPHKVFQVPTLQTIDLSYNEMLGGSLPDFPENGSLKNLTLRGTVFSGNLPESIGNLRLLSHIDLSYCHFSGPIPASIIKLSKLVELSLSQNLFSGPIPASLFFLPSLQTLSLDGNKLSGHINELGNVTSPLESLVLSHNNLEGTIPSFFFRLQSLTSLDLSSNKFFGQMIELQNVTSPLQSLDLSKNSLEGTIPSFFFRLQSLTSLDLSSNKFFGQMIDLENVTSPLQSLDLSSNDFEGTIPPFLFQLQNLTKLYLSSNKFKGIVHLTNFKSQYIDFLDFSNNNLVIETTISTSELPLLPQFGQLYLASCNLQKIPDFLKSQSKLQWLDLSNNTISGEIPNWIWGIGNGQLYRLNLSHNRLTNMKEPMEYGSLHFLDLNSNMLSGQIPRPPPEAMYLDFSNNNFSMIPLDFADQIPDVYFFSIAKNGVSGKISTSCGHLPTDLFLALKAILVERNELNSKPDYLHFTSKGLEGIYYQDSVILSLKGQTYTIEKVLSIFTSIDFSCNQFEGSIPESVGELKQLYLLNISHNALTGNIPPSLENLKALEALDLSFNNLTGNIPVQLEILTFLEVLNLSYNHLVGRIPRSTQLDTFDASSFMGNKGLCGFQLNVSCTGIDEPASPIPESEEKESTHHADLYISVAFGFVAGLGGIFVPLLLSSRWRSYYNKMIDGILSKIFFQRGQGRRKKSR